jgi:hypothetical protein
MLVSGFASNKIAPTAFVVNENESSLGTLILTFNPGTFAFPPLSINVTII